MKKTKKSTIYDLDGTVELKTALPLGIQHILAMFLGNISPILIISGMLQMSTSLKSALIQNAMFDQIFPRIANVDSSKMAWDLLYSEYHGVIRYDQ